MVNEVQKFKINYDVLKVKVGQWSLKNLNKQINEKKRSIFGIKVKKNYNGPMKFKKLKGANDVLKIKVG